MWGLGHTITLMGFAGAALILGLAIGADLASWLEFAVGIMLMALGGHILMRLVRDRVHFHMHKHGDKAHFHAHSHAGEARQAHDPEIHDHDHKSFPFKALFVGMMHGMAGSAALLVLTASTAPTPTLGLAYVVLFGAGSILGMACLSAIIALPIAMSAKALTWGNHAIQATIGSATLGLGLHTVYATQLSTLL